LSTAIFLPPGATVVVIDAVLFRSDQQADENRDLNSAFSTILPATFQPKDRRSFGYRSTQEANRASGKREGASSRSPEHSAWGAAVLWDSCVGGTRDTRRTCVVRRPLAGDRCQFLTRIPAATSGRRNDDWPAPFDVPTVADGLAGSIRFANLASRRFHIRRPTPDISRIAAREAMRRAQDLSR